jgi:hypothetical protein
LDDEFYIGYDPPMPVGMRRTVTRVTCAGLVGVALSALLISAGHHQLEGGSFEFGHVRPFTGVVVEHPYPLLRPDRTDEAAPPGLLLVAPGKYGAAAMMRGLDGQRVSLSGTRATRGGHALVEVRAGSVGVIDADLADAQAARSDVAAPEWTHLRGEVVDTKCFLGVMVPGDGHTHRECAALCLRGGIPPALHVHDAAGRSMRILLENQAGEPLAADTVLPFVGEPLDVRGLTGQRAGWRTLRTDPARWTRVTGR